MNSKILWLFLLLIVWIAAAVLWMGFTLPEMTGFHPLNHHLTATGGIVKTNDPQPASKELEVPSPPSVSSLIDSAILLDNEFWLNPWEEWINRESLGQQVKLIVTGYQLSSEMKHVGLGRAKNFKNALEHHKSIDFVLASEKRDNLKRKGDRLSDVIGVSMIKKLPSATDTLSIEGSPKQLFINNKKLKLMAQEILRSGEHFIELTYCTKNAYGALEENRNNIRSLKDQLNEFGIPRHKIIGNLQECNFDSVKVQLRIK